MARIAGVDLPREKRIEIGLTYIYGIGRKSANDILAATGVNPDVRVKDMDEDDVTKLRDYIDKNFVVEGDLRREIAMNIKRDCRKSDATEVFVIEKDFRFVARRPRQTLVPEKVRRELLLTRRNNKPSLNI